MDFNDALNRVLKYGLSPLADLLPIAEIGGNSGVADPNNVGDGVLADRLADDGDPREAIVRRDLSHRGKEFSDFSYNYHRHAYEIAGVPDGYDSGFGIHDNHLDFDTKEETHFLHKPQDSLHIYTHTHKATGNKSHTVRWELRKPDGGFLNSYDAAMTPDEVKHLLEGLGLSKDNEPNTS